MPLSYYLPSTVRGGVSNTICLRVCLSVFPQNWQLLENRSLVPRPGPTPGRLCGRKNGCRQPSPELRAVRQAGSTSRPGAPSTEHPRIRRRPRGCPGVAGRAPGGSPNQKVGDSREAMPALHPLWSSSRRGSGNRGTEQSLQASRRRLCSPEPLRPATSGLPSAEPLRISVAEDGAGGAGDWQEGGAKKRRRAGGPSLHPRAHLGGKKSSPKRGP